MIKKQLLLIVVLIIGLFINCIILINNSNKNLQIEVKTLKEVIQSTSAHNSENMSENIDQSLSTLLSTLQDHYNKNNRDATVHAQDNNCNGVSVSLAIQSAFYHSLPFDYLIKYLPISNDEYLMEIAKNGVDNTQDLQKEFILKILPLLSQNSSIKLDNNLLSRWIKVEYQDKMTKKQLDLLIQQVSIQDFNNVVQTVETLPEDIKKILRSWQDKVKAYVYAKESLRTYLEQHD